LKSTREVCGRVEARPGKGFSGLENPLFFKDVTAMLYGDAKDSLTRLVQAVQQA